MDSAAAQRRAAWCEQAKPLHTPANSPDQPHACVKRLSAKQGAAPATCTGHQTPAVARCTRTWLQTMAQECKVEASLCCDDIGIDLLDAWAADFQGNIPASQRLTAIRHALKAAAHVFGTPKEKRASNPEPKKKKERKNPPLPAPVHGPKF